MTALPPLDDPRRRLPWIAASSVVLWGLTLGGFAALLRRPPRPPDQAPIEAQIIELPVGGLQPESERRPAAPSPQPEPKAIPRREVPAPRRAPRAIPRKAREPKPSAPSPRSSDQDASGGTAPEPAPASSAPGATSGGSIAGGSDREGARAIYAPVPKIPDDLREEAFQTEATARFNVSHDGTATVTLTKATPDPRLNQIVLDTLEKWRFSPAVRGGVAVDSVFEVRIPIAVR